MLSLFVPLFFAESMFSAFLLPFEWFTYYLVVPIVILAAVCIVFTAEKLLHISSKTDNSTRKNWLRTTSISLIVLIVRLVVFQVYSTYEGIMQSGAFNSTSDINAYDAAVWLNQSYPDAATVVVTKNPGDWFEIFSSKQIISQTHDWEGTNAIADSVLNLDFEIQGSQTLVKAYETNGYASNENFVSHKSNLVSSFLHSSIKDSLSFRQRRRKLFFCPLKLKQNNIF